MFRLLHGFVGVVTLIKEKRKENKMAKSCLVFFKKGGEKRWMDGIS